MSAAATTSPRLFTRPAPAAVVGVKWEIAPAALVASPAGAGVLNGHAPRLAQSWLEWRLSPGQNATSIVAEAALIVQLTDRRSERIVLEGTRTVASWRPLPAARTPTFSLDSEHLRLIVEVPPAPASINLLYAWTGLLARRFELRGGVYDVPDLLTA